jgi:hypothetical protein
MAKLIGMPIRTYVQFMRLGGSGQEDCIRDDGSSFPVEYESAPGETGGISNADPLIRLVSDLLDLERFKKHCQIFSCWRVR